MRVTLDLDDKQKADILRCAGVSDLQTAVELLLREYVREAKTGQGRRTDSNNVVDSKLSGDA